MRANIGNGWAITDLDDQRIVLSKDDPVYRKVTGREGIVRVYGEPGIAREKLIERALAGAAASDAELANIVADSIVLGDAKAKRKRKSKTTGEPLVDSKGNVTVNLPTAGIGMKGNL